MLTRSAVTTSPYSDHVLLIHVDAHNLKKQKHNKLEEHQEKRVRHHAKNLRSMLSH